jgi:hypothetical protein
MDLIDATAARAGEGDAVMRPIPLAASGFTDVQAAIAGLTPYAGLGRFSELDPVPPVFRRVDTRDLDA